MTSVDNIYERELNALYAQYLQSSSPDQNLDTFVLFIEKLSLDDSMQWLQKHSDTKALITERMTQIDPPKISERVCKVYKTLLQQTQTVNPSICGELVSVYIPSKKEPHAQVPRNLLACQSEVFRRQLAQDFSMASSENKAIHLVGDNAEILSQFTSFLLNGSLNLNNQNVLQLHSLATYYDCSSLMEACETYLLDHATKDDLQNLLEYALQNKTASIMTTCKIIIWDNQEQIRQFIRESVLQEEELLPEWQNELMKRVGTLAKLPENWEFYRGRLTVSEVNENKIWPTVKQFKDWGLNALDFREKMAGSSCSKITQKLQEIGLDKQVQELIVHLPNMQIQDVKQFSTISSLKGFANRAFQPTTYEELQKVAKTITQEYKLDLLGLDCKKIPDLNEQTMSVLFLQFPRLRYLAVKSSHIHTITCPPSLVELDCSDCHQITQIDATNTLRILCRYCFQLQTLRALRAKQADCRDCPLLPKH